MHEDLALVVDEALPAVTVKRTIENAGRPLVTEVVLFDVYRGEQAGPGKKSLAFALSYQAPDRSLSDRDIEVAWTDHQDRGEGTGGQAARRIVSLPGRERIRGNGLRVPWQHADRRSRADYEWRGTGSLVDACSTGVGRRAAPGRISCSHAPGHAVCARQCAGYHWLAVNLLERGVFSMNTEPPYRAGNVRAPLYPLFVAGWYAIDGPLPELIVLALV